MSKRIQQLTSGQTEADDLLADLKVCLAYLAFPVDHRVYPHNLIERAFVVQERSTKVISVYINEKGTMKLVSGSLIRATRNWQRVSMARLELTQLKQVRETMVPEDEITTKNNQISYQLAA